MNINHIITPPASLHYLIEICSFVMQLIRKLGDQKKQKYFFYVYCAIQLTQFNLISGFSDVMQLFILHRA